MKFRDFIKLHRGYDLPEQKRIKGDYPVFASTSVVGWHNKYKVKAPGVVTGRSGSLGKVQYVKQNFWPLNTTLFVGDFKNNLPRYVYYFLKTLDLGRFNTGAGVPTLNRNDLDNLNIHVHLFPKQQKISSILSAYDDLIELNERRIKILEEMARLIYKEWFVKFRFSGYEKVRMVKSELGMIPEGWEVKDLDEVIDKITEKYINENNELPLLDLARIPRKSLSIPDYGKSDEITTSRIIFKQYDILFSAIRTYFHKVVLAPKDGITNVSVFVLRSKMIECLEFLFCKLFDRETIDWATQNSGGTKMPVLSWGVFKKMRLLIPNIELVKVFKEKTHQLFEEIVILNKKNGILRQTRDMLLPRLIGGEIDVSNLGIKLVDEKI